MGVEGALTALAQDVQFQLNNVSQNITGYDESFEDIPLTVPVVPAPAMTVAGVWIRPLHSPPQRQFEKGAVER